MQRDPHIGVEGLPSVANVAIRLSAYPYWQKHDDIAGQAIAVEFEEVHKRQKLDSDVGAVSDCVSVFDKSLLARGQSTKEVEGLEHRPVLSFEKLE